MPDQRLLAFYESIRQQAEADRAYKHRVTDGPTVRQYADQLRHEIIKRRLNHAPRTGRLSVPVTIAGQRLRGHDGTAGRVAGGFVGRGSCLRPNQSKSAASGAPSLAYGNGA